MAASPDNSFGPRLPGKFDFTLLFEQAMLSIVPAAVIVLAVPYYVRLALRAPALVRPGRLLWLKLAAGSAMLAVDTASLVLWAQRGPAPVRYSELSVPAAAMSLVSSLCLLVVLYVAHIYSLRTSGFLSVLLTVTMLFDVVMTRSYFRRAGLGAVGALQIVVIAAKFFLVVFEEFPKHGSFRSESLRCSASKETVAGFWNRAVFGWLNSLLIFGFRNSWKLDNLPPIDENLESSIRRYDHFVPKWNRVNRASGYALPMALLFATARDATKMILPRLLFVGVAFSQPFLLFSIVNAVNGELDTQVTRALIAATALVFITKTPLTRETQVTRAIYEHLVYRIMTSTRGILVVAIYDKIQRLPSEELSKSVAVTLMTSGTTAVEQMLSLYYELWSCALQVALGIWSLNLYVGPACYLMLIPGIISFVASHYIGQAMAKARLAWNLEIESRVGATSNVLAQMKGIKSMGLSQMMTEYLQESRRKEIRVSLKERKTRVWLFAFSAISNTLPPILVVAGAIFWTRESKPMTLAEVFTVITIILVAAEPFRTLLMSIFPDALTVAEACVPGEKQSPPPHMASRSMQFAVQFDRVAVTSVSKGPILKEVSFYIPWGSLAMFWGPIASGKSTLLRCILGETRLDSGVVAVGTRSIGYCNQGSWIQNRTLRDNVTGVLEYVEPWYREVIVACGLDVDIGSMVNGDQVMTGTGGCNLSGGQKQRVSLARAVYEQTDILVVDDVFSALDPETAKLVFSNLFGRQGLVRRWNCTVVLTTNHLEFLDDADVIFQLHKGGRVEQQQVELSDESSASGSIDDNAGDYFRRPEFLENGNGEMNDNAELSDNEDGLPANAARNTEPPSVKPATDDIELQNAREKRKYGDWSLYSYYLGASGSFLAIFWVCFTALASTVEQFPIIFIKIWYVRNAANTYYFAGYVGISALNIGLDVMVGGFGQDIFLTSQYLPITLMQFLYTLFTVLVEIGIIAAGSIYTAPIMVFLLAALFIIQFFYLRTSRQLRLLELESAADLYSHFTETSTGIQLVRCFRWQRNFLHQLCVLLDKSQRPYYYLFCCQRWLHAVLDFVSAAAALILVGVSLSRPGGASTGSVALALLSIIGFNATSSFLISSWTNLETGLGAISRIKNFCSETPSEKDTLSGPELSEQWPSHGRLDFNCVGASYQAEDGSLQRALDNVTFTVFPGEKVGISGRTGSGKSSLLMAILRMVDFTGTISIDGRDSRSVPRELLRSRITTLTQDGVELKGSVGLNLWPFAGPKPDEALITSTLQSVGLLNHVNQHGGLNKSISCMGLSVSQKQLLFLARGILHQQAMHTSIVIMDEATSAMDGGTDDALQDLLDNTFAGYVVDI
ncbi:ABC transporter, transmembrane domain, type 1 [Cordyceps fumosorosea ARSEF 2679]|uniref:ABC transporter, transmembrane domain, type 1 n=1 Tax=Cordyceps fumosorosea (strain ARSEF 2679) TaxID=1081104 RepID=A0A167PYW2_CORFA|nr:ABC transporter, transmembrane domain, type 1 [Cordyceps fumosorosea ARSEF 2679]OAA57153.1 ABC transporter, transmembrane domain, type 1 [Cordyceps fumosorosea ARSEF 2679]